MAAANPSEISPSFVLVDWLDNAEMQIADAFEQSLEDDATLQTLAQAWRTSFVSAGALPANMRDSVFIPPTKRGGEGTPGLLGDDYPSELFQRLRAAWAMAARGMAYQQAFMPSGAKHADELNELAKALEESPMPELAATPTTVVERNPWFRLRAVNGTTEAAGEPILIVSSLINRWYVLDLLKSNSFLAMVASLGRPLYLLEWTLGDNVPSDVGLAELCSGPLRHVIESVAKRHRQRQVNLIGYSMGGTLAAIMAARYPSLVARLATVGSPICFDKGGVFTRWLGPKLLDVDLVGQLYDRVPSPIIHLPFWWLRPTIKTRKLVQLSRAFRQPGYLTYFFATEIWNYDNVDLTRGLFQSWAGQLYQRNALVHRQFVVENEVVDLRKIECPVLIISGSIDKIVPPEAAEGLSEHVQSVYRRSLRVNNGHHVRVLTAGGALSSEAVEFTAWLNAPAAFSTKNSFASQNGKHETVAQTRVAVQKSAVAAVVSGDVAVAPASESKKQATQRKPRKAQKTDLRTAAQPNRSTKPPSLKSKTGKRTKP